jgi:flagellar motor switch protein FliG
MTGRDQQAIVLLKLLGEEGIEPVLSRLPPGQADALRRRLRESPAPSMSVQRDVMSAFEEQLTLVKKAAPPAPPPHLRLVASEGSSDVADETEQKAAESFTLSDKPLADLGRLPTNRLCAALASEQPRTVAVLIGRLSPQRIADILKTLPDVQRDQVVVELTRESNVSLPVLERIARTVLLRAVALPASELERKGRIERMADVLRNLEKQRRLELLTALEERDPETSEKLTAILYRFEDLQNTDDTLIQRVLADIDTDTLSTSLFEAPLELKNKILGNLSKRARSAIEEELQFQKKIPRLRVEQARRDLLRIVAKVDREEGA